MNDEVRLGLIVGGAVIIALAIAWRTVVRRRRRGALIRQMRSSDPQTRARGAIGLVDLGLSPSARVLMRRLPNETDDRVRLAVSLAIARRQWEPSNAKRVLELRTWAGNELERQGQTVQPFRPALTRISDMGGPRPADLDPHATPAPPSTGSAEPAVETPVEAPVAPVGDPVDAWVEWRSDGPTSSP